MLFNSFQFLLFFPMVCVLYYIIPDKAKNLWLLLASYYFYMCWNPYYILLLLFSTVLTYACGIAITKKHDSSWRKFFIALCVLLNIGLIAYFKYSTFIFSNVNALLNLLGFKQVNIEIDVLLPVGISFYVFQALGYIIDVYRGEVKAEKNFINYALFVSFFPQLVAGPIERSSHFLPQLKEKHRFDFYRMRDGILLMLYGFFQKVVIADRMGKIVDDVFANWIVYPGYFIVGGVVAFSIQIYCDFGGYSSIAIGAAKVMGFDLVQNFRQPYMAGNVKDFWKRWHISLTSWFRDYLYIPLGGNRKGKWKTILNIFIVFAASGLWHGAAWHYVVWGILNAAFQEIGEGIRKVKAHMCKRPNPHRENSLTAWGGRIVTFALVSFTWLFFRADSVNEALRMCNFAICNTFANLRAYIWVPGIERYEYGIVIITLLALLLSEIIHEKGISIQRILDSLPKALRWLCYMALIFIILLWGVYGASNNENAFIYFQF
ncbi:MAG: MBOAT family protein [Butyrivibrio sp.]|nr:MBOAT family protein [Butyrivibrio sp.]